MILFSNYSKKKVKMKVKFICYHLKNTGKICDKGSTKPEGYRLHFKVKKCQPCSVCSKPTKVDKPTGIDNSLCSNCNKSNYQIRYVNIL